MSRTRYNVAVVGATGAVGTEMLRVLHEQRFPVHRLRLLASSRSAGRMGYATTQVGDLVAEAVAKA